LASIHSLFGFASLISAAIVVAPEMASWIATPFIRVIDNIYFPQTSDPPPVNYTLAHFYREQFRYHLALQEYNKIISFHPFELKAYTEGIQTAFEANDQKSARKFFRRGHRKFSRSPNRILLKKIFDDCSHQKLI